MSMNEEGATSTGQNYNWAILSHTYERKESDANSSGGAKPRRRGRDAAVRRGNIPRRNRNGREKDDNSSRGSADDRIKSYYQEHASEFAAGNNQSKKRGGKQKHFSESNKHPQNDRGKSNRGRVAVGSRRGQEQNWRGNSEVQQNQGQFVQHTPDDDVSKDMYQYYQQLRLANRGNIKGNGEGNLHLYENERNAYYDQSGQRDTYRNGTHSRIGNPASERRPGGEIVNGRYVSSHNSSMRTSRPEHGTNFESTSRGNRGQESRRQKNRANRFKRPIDSEQARTLIEQLIEESYECMVCCEFIRSSQSTWCCQNCYHLFHLRCIKQWVDSSSSAQKDDTHGWRCPGCQNVTDKLPTKYTCFCGKLTNPDWDPRSGVTPHSCGEVCRKERPSTSCTHTCNELCHPGPCPSCPVMVTKECPCGKSRTKMRCGQTSTLRCKNVCEKLLNCGRHRCKQHCHEGSCSECDIMETQKCFCGKNERQQKCGEEKQNMIIDENGLARYSCKNICSSVLDCGNHSCEEICHPGQCKSCFYLPTNVEFCPCKQTRIVELLQPGETRQSCLDPVPCCNNFCGKRLPCGPSGQGHFCKRSCHTGPCGPCDGETVVSCRCGNSKSEIPCAEYDPATEVLCERRCNKKRKCGRHRCNQKCCMDFEHNCALICGRKLTCGLHKCDELCHPGNCPRCWQTSFEERTCYCGETVQYPPIPCGAPLPECKMPCTRPHQCKHQAQHNCHSDEKCPPCVVLMEKWCLCGRETRKAIPCHINNVSCGKPCQKELPCKIHKCPKICHKGECFAADERCKQPCTIRRRDCPHICGAPCHMGEDCPEGPCKNQITVRCKCGRKSEKVLCLAGNSKATFHRFASGTMGDKLKNLQFGQSVDLSGLMIAEKRRGLECDDDCAMFERNKRLADALGVENPDGSHFPAMQFSYALKEEAKANLPLVKTVEDAIENLIHKLRKSTMSQITHSFQPMNTNNRKLIHEIAALYNCKTASYDAEPKRNTVVTATRESSLLNPKLSTVVERKITKPPPSLSVLSFEDKPLTFQGIQKKATEAKPKVESAVDYFDDDFPD